MSHRRIPLIWQVGYSASADNSPDRFVPATVPGSVQLDWARAEGWPPFWQGEEHRRYAWMEDVHWHYRTRLARPASLAAACRPTMAGARLAELSQILPSWPEPLSTLVLEVADHPDSRLSILWHGPKTQDKETQLPRNLFALVIFCRMKHQYALIRICGNGGLP
jgi:hypothetical protein